MLPSSQTSSPLHTSYRHLRGGAAAAVLIALGLAPLVYTLPGLGWHRATFGLLIIYLAVKIYQFIRTGRAIRQLRLEEQFIAQHLDANQLEKCLQQGDHLWKNSRTLKALQKVIEPSSSSLFLSSNKKQRLQKLFHRFLAPMQPTRSPLAPVLGLALCGAVVAGALQGGLSPATARSFQLGLLAIPLLLAAEVMQLRHRRSSRRALHELEEALAAWTLTQGTETIRQVHSSTAYRHTPLYQAPPWFAPSSSPGTA